MTLAHRETSTWNLILAQAETIARTNFVPGAYRGKPAEVAACIMAGRELGIGPMQSLQQIHVIEGKPSASAELQVGLVRAAGHSIVPTVLSDTTCTVVGTRADNGDTLEFTFDSGDAERAGLTRKSNWKNYPQSMLWARAVSQVCRMLFPDVLVGLVSYTPEELGSDEWVDDAEAPQVLEAAVVPVDPSTEDATEQYVADTAKAMFHAAGLSKEQANVLWAAAFDEAGGWRNLPDKFLAVLQEKVNEVSGAAEVANPSVSAAPPESADTAPELFTDERKEDSRSVTDGADVSDTGAPVDPSRTREASGGGGGADTASADTGEDPSPPSDENLRALVRLMRDAPSKSAGVEKVLLPWLTQVLTIWPRGGVDVAELPGWKAAAVRALAAELMKDGAEYLDKQGVEL